MLEWTNKHLKQHKERLIAWLPRDNANALVTTSAFHNVFT